MNSYYTRFIKIVALSSIPVVAVGLAMILSAGCVAPGGTGPSTNVIPQATIDAAAVVLRSAARDTAIVAITPPTGSASNAVYFNLAAQALGTFVTGKDFSPTALQTALTQLNVPQLKNPYVQIGIGTVVDLYQLYYSQYVAGYVSSNAAVAVEMATAIQDGFNQALGNPSPQLLRGVRPSLPSVAPAVSVLPRPIGRQPR